MAEGTRLLSEYGVTSLIEGSNPSLSVLQIAALTSGPPRETARPQNAVPEEIDRADWLTDRSSD